MAANVTGRVSLSCLLCLKEYNVPRTLPCHHTYCEKCLKDYIQNLSGEDFVCPVGCNVIESVNSSIKGDELIKTFPLNKLYASLTKSARLEERECDHCPTSNGTRRAVMWCRNCEGSLCADCTVDHRKRRISVNHDIIDIAKAGDNVSNSFKVDENCPSHKGREFVAFCSVHFELCCSDCRKTNHSGCTFWSIAEASQRKLATMNFEEMTKKISDLSNNQKENIKELDSQYEKHISSMNACIMKAKDKLDSLHKLFQMKSQREKNAKKRQLEILQQQTQMFQTELENSSKVCSSIAKNFSQNQLFIMMTQIKQQTGQHLETIKGLMTGYTDVRVDLQVTDAIQHIESLEYAGHITESSYQSIEFKYDFSDIAVDFTSDHSEPSSSGSYSKNDSSYCNMESPPSGPSQEETDVKQPYPDQQMVTPSLQIYPVVNDLDPPRRCVPSRPELVLENTLNCVKSVKASDIGNRTWLTGGTYLPDGRLILADFGNGQILLCDERYNIIRKERMDVGPQEVAYCEVQNKVYVRTGPKIAKFCLDPHGLRKIGTIKLPDGSNHHCGIALYEDTLIIGSLRSVLLMSRDGDVRRVIRREGKPYSVTVCRPLKQFCYTHNDHIIYCSINGDEVFRYNKKDYECKKVRGMGFDMYGNLYLCCFTDPSGYLYQISQNGQRGRVLLYRGNMKRPRFVLYHPRKHEFIVTSYQERVAFEVAVFD